MDPYFEMMRQVTRRHFLGQCKVGVGAAALASLWPGAKASAATAPSDPMAARAPHFKPKAKSVIFIHLAGSPPQHDLFDYKPKLAQLSGKPCPKEFLENMRFAFIKGHPELLGPTRPFERIGTTGAWVSDLLPHFRQIVDDVTIVKSMYTDQFNHAPAQLFLYSGSAIPGRPSMGSWLTYGLGSEADNLPGFVVLVSGDKVPDAGRSVWGSGFLPGVFQGVQCRSSGEPVLYVSNPAGMSDQVRRRSLDALRKVNEAQHERFGDPETLTRISQYELAYRMQMAVPQVMDITREPSWVHEMYGARPGQPVFANNCLLARRLVEQGVRFVQLFDWGWDVHGTHTGNDLLHQLPAKCRQMDQPVAALIMDLKQRGLLDETLVVWSGEFGRTSMNEQRDGSTYMGRDHHPGCFTIWMAGGGVKRGAVVGETDELGYRVVQTPIHVHDLQATILHLMGLDHERLTYRFQGRDFRLTDVHGHVVSEVLA